MTAPLRIDRVGLDCLVSVDRSGRPTVHHQVGDSSATALLLLRAALDLDPVRAGRVLAAVNDGIAVTAPRKGCAVMPCSDCGQMLDAADMCRVRARERANGTPVLGRIVCPACANREW